MRKAYVLSLVAVLGLGIVAQAESRIEKNLKLEPQSRFVLDSDQGSVTITGKPVPGAKVIITSHRDDLEKLFTITFEEGAGLVRITGRRKDSAGWSGIFGLHYEVELPAETATEIRTGGGSIRLFGLRGGSKLKTSGGEIEVSGLAGRLEGQTSGGAIHLRDVDGDTAIRTSGGSIEAASLGGSLRAHTSGGSIRVNRVAGYVEAKTSGGSVSVNFGRGNASGGDLETSGGSITVRLDPSATLNIDASTSAGSVHSELPVRVQGTTSRSRLQGTLGSGGATLKLHTSGGSVYLKAL